MFSCIVSAGDETNPDTMFRLLNTGAGAQERFYDGGTARVPIAMAFLLASRIVYFVDYLGSDARTLAIAPGLQALGPGPLVGGGGPTGIPAPCLISRAGTALRHWAARSRRSTGRAIWMAR